MIFYDQEGSAGYSIPASEHSTMTSWGGKEGEEAAVKNMITVYLKDGTIVACVMDSYHIYDALRKIVGGTLKQQIIDSGGTLVVRPDSGDPAYVPIKVIEILMEIFGYTTNSKGYKVLPSCIRVIQGDGINFESLPKIIMNMEAHSLSIDNIAFGMGGGLLQENGRDDLGYAMKASAIIVGTNSWEDVFKDPIEGSKVSKKGRLALIKSFITGSESFRTIRLEELGDKKNLLNTVYENGKVSNRQSFEKIKALAVI